MLVNLHFLMPLPEVSRQKEEKKETPSIQKTEPRIQKEETVAFRPSPRPVPPQAPIPPIEEPKKESIPTPAPTPEPKPEPRQKPNIELKCNCKVLRYRR